MNVWDRVSDSDLHLAERILGKLRQPDIIIAPDGTDYLYRWHLTKEQDLGCYYFHLQVASDFERALHDHPWDHQSVILAGGYREILCAMEEHPTLHNTVAYDRRKGDVIWRKAAWSHRLILPQGVPYTMTLFSTGPRTRTWGFWYDEGWLPFHSVTTIKDGRSEHTGLRTGT